MSAGRRRFALFTIAFGTGWRALIAWCVGLAAPVALYLPLYPSIGGNEQMQSLIDSLPPQLTKAINYQAIATGAGYTQSTFFGLIGFLIVTIAAISWGAAAIGGDEESGRLELVLAHDVSRAGVVGQRFAAIAARVLILGAVAFLLVLGFNGPSELGLNVGYLAGTCAAFAALALVTAAVALLFGTIGGSRLWGVAGGAIFAVLSYVLNAVGAQDARLQWLQTLSPYHATFGDDPLSSGANGVTVGLMFAASVLLALAAAVTLRRRDIHG